MAKINIDVRNFGLFSLAIAFAFVLAGTITASAQEISDNCYNADINLDGKVDAFDLAPVLKDFGRTDCSIENLWCSGADINKDGKVDGKVDGDACENTGDLKMVTDNWGKNVENGTDGDLTNDGFVDAFD